MRRHLNNPWIIIPIATMAFAWVAQSYGLFAWVSSKFSDASVTASVEKEPSYEYSESTNLSTITMRVLSRENWLRSNWIRENSFSGDPFVANYDFGKKLIPEFIDVDEVEVEETVIIDQQTFEAAIASKLGLDGDGFFVVFENVLNLPVRKRVGDTIYLLGNGALEIPTFGIAERFRTAEERLEAIELALSKMKLQGVGTQASVPELGESPAGENDSKNIAFIQVEGAEMEIYKQGELVHRDPSLGLDKIIKGESFDSVVLVDAVQNEYTLKTFDLE